MEITSSQSDGTHPKEADSLTLRTTKGKVPLGFVRRGEFVYLAATGRSALWPIEILRAGSAQLEIEGTDRRGATRLLVGSDERDRALRLFREKYGTILFERWYRSASRIVEVALGASPPSVTDPDSRYYRWLTDEFNLIAREYDRHILGNRMNRLLRDRSLAILRPTFASAHRLLEIGCGSGTETLSLLREGHEVLAVDISEEMLEVVRTKARSEGLSERLETRRIRAVDVAMLARDGGSGSFDGAYSTYGALNCEPDLGPVVTGLAELLPPRAAFVAGVYNRWCLFEIVGYSLVGRPGRAFARRGRPVQVGDSRFCVDVYAHSVHDFRAMFSPYFEARKIEGVPVLLPPSDLTAYAERFSRRFDRLAGWDRWMGQRWPMTALGDHFLMVLDRRDRTADSLGPADGSLGTGERHHHP